MNIKRFKFFVITICFFCYIQVVQCEEKRPMFDSADELRSYLRNLNNEYMIAARPRFGKRRFMFQKEYPIEVNSDVY